MFIIFNIVIVGLMSAFFIELAYKWGIVEYAQVHGNNFIYKLFSCDFCMSFWTSLIITLVICFISGDFSNIFIPLGSTVISKKLL